MISLVVGSFAGTAQGHSTWSPSCDMELVPSGTKVCGHTITPPSGHIQLGTDCLGKENWAAVFTNLFRNTSSLPVLLPMTLSDK